MAADVSTGNPKTMKVSLVTVTYNSANTIADTLLSVLQQTYQDIEYWVIDGASTDNSLEVIRAWEPRFGGRMHCISERDGGIYDAMNKGVRNCTGDIVGIINSDDYFTSNTVVEQMVNAFSDDVDAVYGDVHYVKASNLRQCVRYYSGRLYRPWLTPYGFMPPHPALYVRRSVFERYGYYKTHFKISADFEFIARLFYCNHVSRRYIHLDAVTMRTGGASTESFASRMRGTEEDLLACRQLGIKTNRVMIFCKYFIKIYCSLFVR